MQNGIAASRFPSGADILPEVLYKEKGPRQNRPGPSCQTQTSSSESHPDSSSSCILRRMIQMLVFRILDTSDWEVLSTLAVLDYGTLFIICRTTNCCVLLRYLFMIRSARSYRMLRWILSSRSSGSYSGS